MNENNSFEVDANGNVISSSACDIPCTLFGSSELALSSQQDILSDIQSDTELMESSEADVSDVSSNESGSIAPFQVMSQDEFVSLLAVSAPSYGFPNSNSLSFLADVTKGYPDSYKYVSFRTSYTDSQNMVLYIAPVSSVSGNTVTLNDVDVVELTYYRDESSSYNYYIKRSSSHLDSINITLDSSSLTYTNCVPGYGVFDSGSVQKNHSNMLVFAVVFALAFAAFVRLIGGNK